MKARTIATCLFAASATAFACTAQTETADGNNGTDAVTTVAKIKPIWKGPKPGSKNNDLDQKGVLQAWRKVKETFYDKPGLQQFDDKGNPLPLALTDPKYPKFDEVSQCMANTVPNWSDLVMHFYCSMPSYQVVTPNVRGCFSFVARSLQGPEPVSGGWDGGMAGVGDGGLLGAPAVVPGFEQRMIFYPEIYDFCLFQPYDFAKSSVTGIPTPVFDTAEIDKNKARGNKVGVLEWVDDNIADAFKHLMFTWYEPATYKFDQQQNVINAFYDVRLTNDAYGPTDAADVAECMAKRPMQVLDPTDGTHCSTQKPQAVFAPNALAYPGQLKYMTESVTTKPYTPSRL